MKSELPDNVRDVYDAQEYEKWISYEKEYGKVHLIEGILQTVLTVVLLASNAYAWLFDCFGAFPVYVQFAFVILIILSILTVIAITQAGIDYNEILHRIQDVFYYPY